MLEAETTTTAMMSPLFTCKADFIVCKTYKIPNTNLLTIVGRVHCCYLHVSPTIKWSFNNLQDTIAKQFVKKREKEANNGSVLKVHTED